MAGYVRCAYGKRTLEHPLSKEIVALMEKKSSNICFSADVKSMEELLKIAALVGQHIVLLKTHIDTYNDFDSDKLNELNKLAKHHQFILFEDRKFLDIGNTVKMQYTGGIYKIAEWSRLTNATIASGPQVLNALKEGMVNTAKKVPEASKNAILLLAEMSSEDNVFDCFLEKTIKASHDYKEIVIGYISQKNFGDPSFLYMTPGVSAAQKQDGLGQVFRTPESVIQESGSDILIIGRGIYEAENPAVAALAYKVAGWKAHETAIGKFIKGIR